MTRTLGPTARARRTKRGRDARYATGVRADVARRDGVCRIATWDDHPGDDHDDALEACEGRSEWAHLGDKKRFKTRGLPPAERHTTAGSLMLCTRHHRAYDAGRLRITGNADADLRFTLAESAVMEQG